MTSGRFVDLYLRTSTRRPDQTALLRQEADCRTWATDHGLIVRAVHRDVGRSAYGERVRDGLEAALVAVTAGVVDTLLIWKVDRLSRRGADDVCHLIGDVEIACARIVFVKEQLDTSVPASRPVIRVLAEYARMESAEIGLRVESAKSYLRRQGRWIGGAPPFGYTCDSGRLRVHPEQGAVVRSVITRVERGAPLIQVTTWLNTSGTPSPRGGRWSVGTLAQLLRSPTMAGLLPETVRAADGRYSSFVVAWRDPVHGETVSVMADGEVPLMQPARQAALLAVLRSRRVTGDDTSRAGGGYLLTGLVTCAGCGGRASVVGNSYCCQKIRLGRSCPDPARGYVPAVDAAVMAAWMDKVRQAAPGSELQMAMAERSMPPKWVAQRRCLRDGLRDLEEVVQGRSALEEAASDPGTAWKTERREDLRRKLGRYVLPVGEIETLRQSLTTRGPWDVDVDENRRLLRLAIDSIQLTRGHRGQRFDPSRRLRYRWADASHSAS